MIRIFLLLLIVVSVAACSEAPAATDLPFHTATPALQGTPDLSDSGGLFGGVDLPDSFMGGDPLSLTLPGVFRFAVNGAFSARLESGTVIATTVAAYATTPERQRVVISASDDESSHQLTFEWNPALVSGVYEIVSPGTFAAGEVTASYTRLNRENAEDSILQTFEADVNGSITLTIGQDNVGGLFQFSAQRTLTSDSGEIETQTVQISGEFSDVVLLSGDDPFDNTVPLPTRIFVGTEVP